MSRQTAVACQLLLAGSAANMSAQAIVFPFDTIRKRLMNDGIDGRPKLYRCVRMSVCLV